MLFLLILVYRPKLFYQIPIENLNFNMRNNTYLVTKAVILQIKELELVIPRPIDFTTY